MSAPPAGIFKRQQSSDTRPCCLFCCCLDKAAVGVRSAERGGVNLIVRERNMGQELWLGNNVDPATMLPTEIEQETHCRMEGWVIPLSQFMSHTHTGYNAFASQLQCWEEIGLSSEDLYPFLNLWLMEDNCIWIRFCIFGSPFWKCMYKSRLFSHGFRTCGFD